MIIVGQCFRVQTDRTSIEPPFRESVASVQSESWFVHGRCPLTGILIPAAPYFRHQVESFSSVLSRFGCVNSPSRGNCLLLRPRRNARHDELTMEHYRYYAGDPLTLQPYERNRISRDNYAPNFEPENVAGPTKQNSTKGGKIHPAVSGQRHDSSFFFAAACQAPASWQ